MLMVLQICIISLCCYRLMCLVIHMSAKHVNMEPEYPLDPILMDAVGEASEAWLEMNRLRRSLELTNDPMTPRYDLRKAQTEHALAMAKLCRLCGKGNRL